MKIEKRGRTFDAVLNPKNYTPFQKINNSTEFNRLWSENPYYILANMAHAAYCDKDTIKQEINKFSPENIIFYTSHYNKNGILRGREAFLAIWKDKAILSFRGTEGNDRLEVKINQPMINVLSLITDKKLGDITTFIGTDLLDDANLEPLDYQGPPLSE